jgi:hypothetical protein
MWLMPFLHAAFCFGHGAFAVWSCGVLKSSCGVSLSVMGRLPPYREDGRPRCPIRRCAGNEDVAPPIFTFYFPLTLTGFDWNFVKTLQNSKNDCCVLHMHLTQHAPIIQVAKHTTEKVGLLTFRWLFMAPKIYLSMIFVVIVFEWIFWYNPRT